jgi:hypothetical protein
MLTPISWQTMLKPGQTRLDCSFESEPVPFSTHGNVLWNQFIISNCSVRLFFFFGGGGKKKKKIKTVLVGEIKNFILKN